MSVTIWHNPRCSKSRSAMELLADRGVEPEVVRYLDAAPTRADLEDVLRRIGTEDPRTIVRTGEARYRELGLVDAGRDALLDALAAHPVLIERPIVVVGDRAVVARPPERVLELLPPERSVVGEYEGERISEEASMSRSVVRAKGQVTLPREVRAALHVEEGDDVLFTITDEGVLLRGLKSIPADQAWFWSEDWQRGEREASDQLAAGRGTVYADGDAFLESLR